MFARTFIAALLAVIANPLCAQVVIATGLDDIALEALVEGSQLSYRLTNQGAKPVTAWAVRLIESADGGRIGESDLTSDGWVELFPFEAAGYQGASLASGPTVDGVIFPGQIKEANFSLSLNSDGMPADQLEVNVTALVYEDVSSSGRAEVVRQIFAERNAEWKERTRWNAELSSRMSASALRALIARMRSAGPSIQNASSAQLKKERRVRERIATNLQRVADLGAEQAVPAIVDRLRRMERLAAVHSRSGDAIR